MKAPVKPNKYKDKLKQILKRDAVNNKFLTDIARELEQIDQLLNLKEYPAAKKRLQKLYHEVKFRNGRK